MLRLYTIFIAALLLAVNIRADIVPVYMWETHKTSPIVPSLGRLSQDTFGEILRIRLEKNPRIVVYSEHSLSPEDFIGHDDLKRNTFEHLADLGSTTSVSYLPYVENPINVIKELVDHEIAEVSAQDLLNQPTIPEYQVLLIKLNDARDDEDRNDMLRRHDSVVFQIHKKLLKKNENILSIFTANHASWVIPENIRHHRFTRSTTEERETAQNGTFYETDYSIMYLREEGFYHVNGTNYTLNGYAATAKKEGEVITVEMTTGKEPSFKMNFVNLTNGYWLWEYVNVTLNGKTSVFTPLVSAPISFAYHCGDQTFFIRENKNENITFPGLQVQPFFGGEANKSIPFGDAYDCVGFTSAPIWSGLFVTFILAFIIAIGLTMMMDIKTMDRFDDPKGKTIIINASE